jgi:hypothetical protein
MILCYGELQLTTHNIVFFCAPQQCLDLEEKPSKVMPEVENDIHAHCHCHDPSSIG